MLRQVLHDHAADLRGEKLPALERLMRSSDVEVAARASVEVARHHNAITGASVAIEHAPAPRAGRPGR